MTLYIIFAFFVSCLLSLEGTQNAATAINEIIDRSTGFGFTSSLNISEKNRGIDRKIASAKIDVTIFESDTLESLSTVKLAYPEQMRNTKISEYRYNTGKIKRLLLLPEEEVKDITNDAFYDKLSFSFGSIKDFIDCENTIVSRKEDDKSIIIESICDKLIDHHKAKRRIIKINYSSGKMIYMKEYNEIGDVVRKISFVNYAAKNLKLFPLEVEIEEPRKRKKTIFIFSDFKFKN